MSEITSIVDITSAQETPTESGQTESQVTPIRNPHWDTVLIANRGEIACRVIRAAQALGLRSVAVFSDDDREAPHVSLADTAVYLGPAEASASYLNLDKIMEAAQISGAGAIHPGYGFFSENPALPTRCLAEGITWVGPPIEAIKLMGDKRAARVAVATRGVPVVPGYDGEDQRDERLIEEAKHIGFPLMVKASMGGGGKGMRLVHSLEELESAIATARREASAAFGDGDLILERAVINPKHIEIQVFADEHGHVVHLGERECSLQRRHQKVIEEAPSPALTPELRAEMGSAAVEVARSVGYVGAGTVEFLLDCTNHSFYFLEMNTRIQVEHPVTEEVYGVDLVAWQLEVARGMELPLTQEEINAQLKGHAIEARLYAEDPARGFMPQAGVIYQWTPPQRPDIRVDDGVGTRVSPSYDPMLAKIIAKGPNREVARRRLIRALDELVFIGPHHNLSFLKQLLQLPDFINGTVHTRTIDDAGEPNLRALPSLSIQAIAAVALSVSQAHLVSGETISDGWGSGRRATWITSILFDSTGHQLPSLSVHESPSTDEHSSVLTSSQRWRVTQLGVGEYRVQLLSDPQKLMNQEASQRVWKLSQLHFETNSLGVTCALTCQLDGMCYRFPVYFQNSKSDHDTRELILLNTTGDQLRFTDLTYMLEAPEGSKGNERQVRAPMSGKIIAVLCEPGQVVQHGDTLVILEAMKLEHQLTAHTDGVAREVCVAVGDQVSSQQVLIELDDRSTED